MVLMVFSDSQKVEIFDWRQIGDRSFGPLGPRRGSLGSPPPCQSLSDALLPREWLGFAMDLSQARPLAKPINSLGRSVSERLWQGGGASKRAPTGPQGPK